MISLGRRPDTAAGRWYRSSGCAGASSSGEQGGDLGTCCGGHARWPHHSAAACQAGARAGQSRRHRVCRGGRQRGGRPASCLADCRLPAATAHRDVSALALLGLPGRLSVRRQRLGCKAVGGGGGSGGSAPTQSCALPAAGDGLGCYPACCDGVAGGRDWQAGHRPCGRAACAGEQAFALITPNLPGRQSTQLLELAAQGLGGGQAPPERGLQRGPHA